MLRPRLASSNSADSGDPRAKASDGRGVASRRAGFTLVEMMVAVVILSVGLLGLAGTSAVVTRQVAGGASQSVAANAIQSRLEWLRSMPCPMIKDSTAVNRGIRERWVPGVTANGILFVRDTVWYKVGGTPRRHVYTMTVPCR